MDGKYPLSLKFGSFPGPAWERIPGGSAWERIPGGSATSYYAQIAELGSA